MFHQKFQDSTSQTCYGAGAAMGYGTGVLIINKNKDFVRECLASIHAIAVNDRGKEHRFAQVHRYFSEATMVLHPDPLARVLPLRRLDEKNDVGQRREGAGYTKEVKVEGSDGGVGVECSLDNPA